VVAGDGQSALVNAAYLSPLKVVVKDSLQNLVSGATVTFTAPAPTGASVTFAPSSMVTTDANGLATVTVTANSQMGAFQVTAAVAGIAMPATFGLTNLPLTASHIAFVQQPSNAQAGVVISPAVSVQLKDTSGTNVAQGGTTVTLSLGGATLSGNSAVTNAGGLATFSNLSVATAGTYQLIANASSLLSAQSNQFQISAGAAANIVASGTPQSTTVLGPFPIPLRVQITDSFNNPLSGITVTFTAPPGTGPSATFSSTSVMTDSTGLASVTASANGFAGGPYNVTASAGALTATFALTNIAGSAASLVFTQQPVNTTAGATMASVVLKVTDSANNPVSGVMVGLTAQGGSGVLSGGTAIATDMNGLATFSALSINKVGTYSLQATDGTRFTSSNSFVVSPGMATSITVVAGDGQSAPVGGFYPSALKVSVQDMNDNAVPGVSVTFTPPPSGPSVSFTGSPTVVTDSTGVAAVSVTANSIVGSFQVNANANGIGPAIFNLTNIPGTASQLRFV
jgi:adhesin/invasin